LKNWRKLSNPRLIPPMVLSALASACGGNDAPAAALPTAADLATACPGLSAAAVAQALPVAKTNLTKAALVAATATAPEHCQIDGEINRRTGIDGQSYAIRFRLRMPTATWNGRFFMGGGGGTNGTLVDPTARLAQGYATIGTDGGHDNAVNNVATAGGTSSFGVDPHARVDFAYNAYDQVTQVGKALVNKFYQQSPRYSYFVGCSEGGREAMLMTQRFPTHYDGVVAGDPVLHIPLGPLAGLYTTKLFAGLAQRSGLVLANGDPGIVKTYSDPDLLLMRNAVLAACDALDGLADGIVDNQPACTPALVSAKLADIQCTAAKTDTCLSADQIDTMSKMMLYQGASDSSVSIKDTLRWYDAMNAQMGSNAQDFARMYVVPGMAHCSGGPATDSFDMLAQLVDWVEKGTTPDSVPATASNPGYFGVTARTRPLCPYPKQTRYKGSGDINDAANFTCQ
jgi:pimeloyl-ACP methyl ester carboxylesterase